MEIRELLARLDHHRGSFPGDLVAEAVARRDEIIPILLETLESIESDPEPWLAGRQRMVHIHAMYLLALFRETRAYPLFVRIFSRPGEFPFDLAGDVVTQDLSRILASVSGGDMTGIATLIENEQANEFVRSVAMGGLVSLVFAGRRSRDEVIAYFLYLFQKLERNPGAQWDGLANFCADLWPQETYKELECAYEDGLVNPGSIAWQDIEDALKMGKEAAIQRARHREPLITDLAKAMGWMQCCINADSKYEPLGDLDEVPIESPSSDWPAMPIRRTAPKVGRNEPCPCGSGKKFKKCCGS